jgi:chloramphenicol-sensitive protein RarD
MLLGVWFFHETFTPERLAGFAVIWGALGLYVAEGLWATRRRAG